MIEVPDESGFLAILDPDAYEPRGPGDWARDQLFTHLKAQMRLKRLLVWATGASGVWRVEVETRVSLARGFREARGPIVATRGRLCLSNYDHLTEAAASGRPVRPEIALTVQVPRDEHGVRVVQFADPRERREEGFLLEVLPARAPLEPWAEIPWM